MRHTRVTRGNASSMWQRRGLWWKVQEGQPWTDRETGNNQRSLIHHDLITCWACDHQLVKHPRFELGTTFSWIFRYWVGISRNSTCNSPQPDTRTHSLFDGNSHRWKTVHLCPLLLGIEPEISQSRGECVIVQSEYYGQWGASVLRQKAITHPACHRYRARADHDSNRSER